jgi:hypothetical protein
MINDQSGHQAIKRDAQVSCILPLIQDSRSISKSVQESDVVSDTLD